RQVELQDGDIIGIDDYLLQVRELSAAAQPIIQPVPAPAATRPQPAAAPVAPAPAVKAAPAAIPSEIWDSLAQEFSISDNLSSRSKANAQRQANPLTAP
ncbi:hypothetical protein LXA25_18205, partial [Erwinia amylovora]|nr:hypothetical protein [Erwinia amylovora]